MKIQKSLLSLLLLIVVINFGLAQCQSWNNIKNVEEVQEAYVLFRDFFKRGKFEKAFPYWETVYEYAPATNGKRNFVYINGRTLYFEKFKQASKKSQKIKHAKTIMRLYQEEQICFLNSKTILPPNEIVKYLEKHKK